MSEDCDCVVVGAGPGGAVLAHGLARAGARVTLLESRADFARRFRGDTLSPAVMDHLHDLGLAEEIMAQPHATADGFTWHSPGRSYRLADFRTASRRHPFYVLFPQTRLLELLTRRAAAHPGFHLELSARVNGLVTDPDGRVRGVRWRDAAGAVREIRAPLVVGADGRFSQLRRLGGFDVEELGAGLDILWFEVPRHGDTDPELSGLDYFSAPGRALVALGQGATWQLGYVIPTGTVAQARAAGVGPVVELMRQRLPWLGDRIDSLTDVNQLTLLNVRITRLPRWYRPGLLLIGDAAHVISPVGGNGINIAVADAAEAANTLAAVLLGRRPGESAGDPALDRAVDEAAALVERRRRVVSDAEQRSQVRAEAGSLERLRRGDPRPIALLRVIAAVPALARWSGRRSAAGIAVPPPSPLVLGRGQGQL